MEAKNIRIGNFVWVDNKEHHPKLAGKTLIVCGTEKLRHDERGRVQMNHIDDMENITLPAVSQFENFIKAIPITEDWLKDLGFEYRLENAGNLPCYKINCKGWDCIVARWGVDKENLAYWQVWIETKDIVRVQYLHELQNLFFAISGSELQLKNKS